MKDRKTATTWKADCTARWRYLGAECIDDIQPERVREVFTRILRAPQDN